MAGTSQQPSRVATADTPPDRPANVITDETTAARDDSNPLAAPTAKAGQTTDDSASADDKSSKPRRDRSAERKIARLTKKLSEAENTTAADRKRIEALEQQLDELKDAKPAPAKPARKDFDSDEAYARAFAKWDSTHGEGKKPAGKKDGQQPGKRTPAPDQGEQRPAPNAKEISDFKERGTKKLGDDFLEAYQNPKDVAVNQAMGDFILDSDMGPELYVWLFNNPEEARRLYYKSETAVVRRLEKVEKLIQKAGTWDIEEEEKPGKGGDGKGGKKPAGDDDADTGSGRTRRSKAPDPPSDDDRGNTVHEKSLEDADMDEYAEIRRRQIKKSGVPLL